MFDLYQLCSRVHPLGVPVHVLLDVGGKPYCSPRQFQGRFFQGLLCWTILRQVAVAKVWTIINLEISLKGMADWEDQALSLTVQLNRSISGTCSSLGAQFSYMQRSAISSCRGSNSLSSCIRVIWKPRFSYSLLAYLIPSLIFFTFRFLIILPVSKIICRYIVFRNPIPLMCMR